MSYADHVYYLNEFQARHIAMAKLVNPVAKLLVPSRVFQLIVVGFAAMAAVALAGSASALPPMRRSVAN